MNLDTNRRTHKTVLAVEEKTVKLVAAGCEFEAVNAAQFEVEAEFTYLPAIAPILTGPWEDADPGAAAEIDIQHLLVVKDTAFDCDEMVPDTVGGVEVYQPGITLTIKRGRDVLNLFSLEEIEALEGEILQRALTGDTDD